MAGSGDDIIFKMNFKNYNTQVEIRWTESGSGDSSGYSIPLAAAGKWVDTCNYFKNYWDAWAQLQKQKQALDKINNT